MITVKKLFGVFNVVLCIYGLLTIILHFLGYQPMPADAQHITVSIIVVIIWILQFVTDKEINVFTSVSFLIILCIWPFSKLLKLIPFVILFAVVALRNGRKFKDTLNALWDVCVITLIIAILASGPYLIGTRLTNHIANEDTSYYLSDDGRNKIEIYSCCIDETDTYRYLLSYSKGVTLDLKIREFKRFVPISKYDLQLKKDAKESFKWIDSDTFEFAGEQYEINK